MCFGFCAESAESKAASYKKPHVHMHMGVFCTESRLLLEGQILTSCLPGYF